MSNKSITILEAKMAVMEATVKLLQEEIAELKSAGGSSSSVVGDANASKSERNSKGKSKSKSKREVDPDAPKREKSDKVRALDQKREQIKSFFSDTQKGQMKTAGYKGNPVFTLSSYITDDTISAEVVAAAVTYLVENPDYKSKTAKDRSEKSSVASVSGDEKEEKVEKEKVQQRGRPKKAVVVAEKKDIMVVTPSEETGEDTAEEWEYKGEKYYKLTKSNYVINEDFEYEGLFDGKKIDRKVPMPDSVKKYLETLE